MGNDETALSARQYIKRMNKARIGPHVTCPASRHVAMMAEGLSASGVHPMIQNEPHHCAESLAAVVAALWEARAELARMKGDMRQSARSMW